MRTSLKGLKLQVWRHQTLNGCLTGDRQRPLSRLLFLITGPLRMKVGHWFGLTGWLLARMPFTVLMVLTGTLTGSLTSSLVLLLDWPRAAAPLTEFLSPKLSDLLTYLLLQPWI